MASQVPVGLALQSLQFVPPGMFSRLPSAISSTWSQIRPSAWKGAGLPRFDGSLNKPSKGPHSELSDFMRAYPELPSLHAPPRYNGSPVLASNILQSGKYYLRSLTLRPSFQLEAVLGKPNTFPFSSLPGTSRRFSTSPTFCFDRILPAPRFPGRIQIRHFASPPAPSQQVLYRAEQGANASPQNAGVQEKFYDTLLRANLPQFVIDRYQTGQYATSRACEDKYIRALESTGQIEKARMIVDRRNEIVESGVLSNGEVQAISQAVAAQTRGGSFATGRGTSGTSGYGRGAERDNPIHVVVDESVSGVVFRWVKFLFYFGLTTYFLLVFLTLAIEATGPMRKATGTQSNEAQASQQTARFTDVHGCDEAKEDLQELVEFLKDPTQFSTLGGKLPKGVLLVGPPGTGKTLLARAVAGEAGVPFFFMSGSEFDEVYVGVGAKRVRELFAQARAKAPAIVFIDELDAIGGKRNERDAAYVKQTLNQLLVDLDGFSPNSGVIFLAATNFPQLLDKALTRPGRFDRNINVPLPDVRGRIAILKHHAKNIKISPEIDLSILARGTPGFSGAELENLVNQAAVRASRLKATNVGIEHFEWAKDKIVMGAERRSAVIPEAEKKMTAYHEGGHALVGLKTQGHTPVYKVTIMPRGQALGLTSYLPEGDRLSLSKKQMIAHIDSALGGKIAEELVYGTENVTGGCSSDLQQATKIARRMVMELGMSELVGDVNVSEGYRHLSPKTKELVEREVRRILEESRGRATNILTTYRKELDLLANALMEYESLNLEEMRKVIAGEKLTGKLGILPNAPIKIPEKVFGGPKLEGGSAPAGSAKTGGDGVSASP